MAGAAGLLFAELGLHIGMWQQEPHSPRLPGRGFRHRAKLIVQHAVQAFHQRGVIGIRDDVVIMGLIGAVVVEFVEFVGVVGVVGVCRRDDVKVSWVGRCVRTAPVIGKRKFRRSGRQSTALPRLFLPSISGSLGTVRPTLPVSTSPSTSIKDLKTDMTALIQKALSRKK